jgi:diphthine-ammonia ligase
LDLIDELDSYMYQSVGHEMIDLFAKAMELPLYRAEIKGDAQTTEKEYKQPVQGDEVEDLYELLSEIKVNSSILLLPLIPSSFLG